MAPMRKSWWLSAPLAWAGVVAVVALIAWWVIDAAGTGIIAEPAHDAVTPAPSAIDRPTADHTDRPRPTPSDPSPASTAGTTPTTPPTTTATSAPPPPTRSADQPERRTLTWQGDAGLLRVSCAGSSLRLESASPHDGYVIEEKEIEAGRELEVKFRSASGDREVEIHAVCVGGVPDFAVNQSGTDD